MRLRDNDVGGLLWDRLTGEGFDRRMATPRALVRAAVLRPPMPHSDWRPPAAPLNLAGAKRIAIDCETCDPDLKKLGPGVRRGGYIVGLAIGIDGGPRQYAPIRHEGGDNCEWDVLAWARDTLNAFTGEIIGAKCDYDLDFLAECGVHFTNVSAFHDVLVAEPLLDEWRLSYSLDSLAKDYLGEGKEETLLSAACAAQGYDDPKTSLWRLPARFVGPYAEADVDRPLRILPLQQARIKSEGLDQVYNIERRLIPVLLAMRRRGVRVDIGKAEQVKATLEQRRLDLSLKLKHLAGPSAEWMAPASFVQAIKERGIEPPLTPKSHQPSITKFFLEAHADDELCNTIAEGRRLNTTITTFLEGHILGHNVNGRIHCQWHQLKSDEGGTIGRLASSLPNLQNLPARDDELGPLIRSIFVPDSDRWHKLDLSQIEYRFLAHFARGIGAEEVRAKYRDDPKTDYHKFTAEMCGIDPEDKRRRKMVKGINFAKLYGAQVGKLAALLHCSRDEAQKFVDHYEHALPFTMTTFNAAKHWAERRGFVETILGRKQRFPLWEPQGARSGQHTPMRYDAAVEAYGPNLQRAWTYTALNKKLQISSADHIKKAMVDAWEAGLPPALLQVHDEIDTDAPPEAVAEWKHILETSIKLSVPLVCDVESGSSWGDCS